MNLIEAQKFIEKKNFGKALDICLEIEKKNSNEDKVLFYLGLIYFELNDYKKSVFYYEKFLKKAPNSVSALYNLAIAKQFVGQTEKAKEIYNRLIKKNKNNVRAYYGLYVLDQSYLSDEKLNYLDQIKNNEKLSLYEKGIINFIFSKKEKNKKNYKQELEYLKKFHSKIFKSNYAYNISSQFYYNKIIGNYFKKFQFIKKNNYNKIIEELEPIFIIGLPRSGSTLIESILTSSVEKINTCGESHVVNMAVLDQIGPKIYEKNFNINSFKFEINLDIISKAVLDRYFQFNKKNNYKFVDKSLENFFNVEIIKEIFPKAKFLHTYRRPLDSIISIYQSMLSDLSWTHTFEDIFSYVDNYLKVLNYLKDRDCNIMHINLEKFTDNSEEMSKKIFDFCNLTWSKDILQFYERKDLFAKTLSFNQIRSKILKYNNQKYQPYFDLLNDYKKKYDWLNN